MSTVADAPRVASPDSIFPVGETAPPTAAELANLPALEGPRTLRPSDAGRRMAFEDYILCDFEDGCFYELARGIIVVAEVPGGPAWADHRPRRSSIRLLRWCPSRPHQL